VSVEGSFAIFSRFFSKSGKKIVFAKMRPIVRLGLGAASHIIAVITKFSFHCSSQRSFNKIRDPFRFRTIPVQFSHLFDNGSDVFSFVDQTLVSCAFSISDSAS